MLEWLQRQPLCLRPDRKRQNAHDAGARDCLVGHAQRRAEGCHVPDDGPHLQRGCSTTRGKYKRPVQLQVLLLGDLQGADHGLVGAELDELAGPRRCQPGRLCGAIERALGVERVGCAPCPLEGPPPAARRCDADERPQLALACRLHPHHGGCEHNGRRCDVHPGRAAEPHRPRRLREAELRSVQQRHCGRGPGELASERGWRH
mmetsp:Transcript_11181/g.39615  ORF Transcript_11181/g.39615 Transcript_11181/m.39615 type:complete len:204 (+) Transcript_11181:447-1058(+)